MRSEAKITLMPVAGWESRKSAVHCVDLLASDETQLLRYLQRQDRGDEFDVSSLVGVESLSQAEKDDLTQRLRWEGSLSHSSRYVGLSQS